MKTIIFVYVTTIIKTYDEKSFEEFLHSLKRKKFRSEADFTWEKLKYDFDPRWVKMVSNKEILAEQDHAGGSGSGVRKLDVDNATFNADTNTLSISLGDRLERKVIGEMNREDFKERFLAEVPRLIEEWKQRQEPPNKLNIWKKWKKWKEQQHDFAEYD